MILRELVNDIVIKIISEINQPDTSHKIKTEIINPLVRYILEQLYPYLITTCVIFVLMFLCIITTLILVLGSKKSNATTTLLTL
jgi:hypothetical protein